MSADVKRIQDALDALSEHYDTVQIFATRHEAGSLDGTLNFQRGVGNWYARRGQVADWLEFGREDICVQARKMAEGEGGK